MGIVKGRNQCLGCWFYKNGKCLKTPYDYCRITRSK